jgi:hypothetical protein
MVLTAYFDESIRQDGDEPICVGGYLFKSKSYERFCDRWRRSVLKLTYRDRLRHFHMTDLCAGRGEYSRLSIAARVGVLDRAVAAIIQHAYVGLAAHFSQVEFIRVAPPNWPDKFGSMYSTACALSVQFTAHHLRERGCHLRVRYVFEAGHRRQAEADDVLRAIAAHPQADETLRYEGHRFGAKDEPGLQAADLLCWTLTKATVARGTTPPAFKPFVPSVQALALATNDHQGVYGLSGPLLKDFMLSQVDPTAPTASVPLKFRPGARAFR